MKALWPYQKTALMAIRKLYAEEYQHNLTATALNMPNSEPEEEDIFVTFMNVNSTKRNEFEIYLNGAYMPLSDDANLFKWGRKQKSREQKIRGNVKSSG